jgi:hypothetical protein
VASVQQRLEQGVHLATLRLMKDASYQASTYDVTSTLALCSAGERPTRGYRHRHHSLQHRRQR